MSRLLCLTWLWDQKEGRAKFKAEHVNIWAAMVHRHCTLDLEFACVTDMPAGIDPSIRIIEPPGFYDDLKTSRWRGGRPSCFRRLSMFRSDAAAFLGADRFVSMDLDLVVSGSIDTILDRPEDFVICGPSQDGPRFLYNGSMILMSAGARPCVYDDFTPEGAEVAGRRFVGSDQAWIAHSLGAGEATWTAADGVVRWASGDEGPLMFFPGTIKPWGCLADPFVAQHYRAADRAGTALILGEKNSVWDDFKAAGHGPFTRVIALPKSARMWRGKVDHVAEDIAQAKAIAAMLGHDEIVICGA